MKPIILPKPCSCLLVALFVICLAGCEEDIILSDGSGKIIGKGVLEITANSPSPARLVLDGKEYSGSWSTENIYEANLAKSRRLIGDRAYLAYETGNDPAQLKHGHASLMAGDGLKIQCDFYYRSQPNAGSCDMDGKQLKLTVHHR